MNLQDGKFANIVGSRLIGEEFFVFGNFFGRIVQKCDYEELENRDMVKPVRREELAISPRLAKVMINFSEVKSGGKLADFFCGIGVILQEALLQELEVIGIDTDVRAIAGAKKNLEWFKFPKEKYQIINDDSRKVQIKGTDVMVSEPDLGEKLRVTIERKKKIILRKTYTQERAKERMQEFENLMIDVLGNVKKKISGRIVFTAPFIKSSDRTKERIGCNIARICERTKLKLASGFPIADFREGQITGRQIFVLER